MAILLRSTRRVVRKSCKSLGTAVLVVLFLLDTAVTGIFLGLLWNAVVRSPQGCASAARVSRICGQSGAAFMSVLLMPFTLHWVVWTGLDLQATSAVTCTEFNPSSTRLISQYCGHSAWLCSSTWDFRF